MAPPDLTPSTGSPAGYGKSCMNCSRAKCKCILRAEGSGCERCHRLGKECQPMSTSRKRTVKKSTSSRTAQLEEKLEDLVSILRASQQQQQPPNQHISRSGSADAASAPYTSRLDSLATAATVSSHQPPYETCRTDAPLLTFPQNNIPPFYEPAPAEAERRLGVFRSWLKSMPFMILPPDVTPATLRHERPFLWLCINNITTSSVREQTMLKERTRIEVAQRMLLDYERSLDLLLGLITCLAWVNMHIGNHNKPYMATYSQLALSLVSDLGLSRTPGEEYYIARHFKAWHGRIPPAKPRTTEERRAVLALWFVISTYSCVTGKTEIGHWTTHMQENLEYLEQQKEEPLDEVLTALVKTQLIADEALVLLVSEVSGNATKAPGHIFKKDLLLRLNNIRDKTRPQLSSHYAVQALMVATELMVHSLGSSTKANPDLSRIEGMYSCLQVAKAWYDIFFSLPLSDLAGAPFFIFAELGQTLSALYRLATSEDQGWDKRLVYKEADPLVILEQVIQRLLEISSAYPMEHDGEVQPPGVRIAKIMRGIKTSWEPILNQQMNDMLTPNSQAVPAATADPSSVEAMPIVPDPYSMDFNEIAWMTDVFGPWEL